MKAIYKYKLDLVPNGLTKVMMPDDAQVLTVGVQYDEPVLRAMVEDTKGQVPYYFYGAFTGAPLPEVGRYVGTLTVRTFVFHLFEHDGPSVDY